MKKNTLLFLIVFISVISFTACKDSSNETIGNNNSQKPSDPIELAVDYVKDKIPKEDGINLAVGLGTWEINEDITATLWIDLNGKEYTLENKYSYNFADTKYVCKYEDGKYYPQYVENINLKLIDNDMTKGEFRVHLQCSDAAGNKLYYKSTPIYFSVNDIEIALNTNSIEDAESALLK